MAERNVCGTILHAREKYGGQNKHILLHMFMIRAPSIVIHSEQRVSLNSASQRVCSHTGGGGLLMRRDSAKRVVADQSMSTQDGFETI